MLLMLLGVALGPAPVDRDPTCRAENVRWEPRAARIVVSGPATCTLPQVRELVPDAPLTSDGKVWHLDTNLHLERGATVRIEGTAAGGAVDELRLRSDDAGFVEIRAEWGNLAIRSTKVTSWDEAAQGPDLEHATGRAFIRVVSFMDGDVPRASRMDVVGSDIGYLGYAAAESYGLVWKVRDGAGPHVFDELDVYGSLVDSDVHHNYFGMYSYGAWQLRIAGNEVHDNVQYGVDPHDDSDALVIEDNFIHHNGNHGFICSKRCDNLVIRNNVSSDNAQTGFMFHRAVVDSLLEGNVAERNVDAGFAIMDSHDNVIRDNVARANKYGLRLSVGASGNVFSGNELEENSAHGIYLYQGSDLPTVNDGRPMANRFVENVLRRNGSGIRASNADANVFERNVFEGNGVYLAYLFDANDNVFAGNAADEGHIYLSGLADNQVEDSARVRVHVSGADASMAFRDTRGRALANEAGVHTTVGRDGASLLLTSADTVGVVEVDAVALSVAPADGDVEVAVHTWDRTAREWSTQPGSATTADFAVGELRPGAALALRIDGADAGIYQANPVGEVRFTADVGAAPRTFTLRPRGPERAGGRPILTPSEEPL